MSATLVAIVVALAWGSSRLLRRECQRGAATEPVFFLPPPPGIRSSPPASSRRMAVGSYSSPRRSSTTGLRLRALNSVETHVLPARKAAGIHSGRPTAVSSVLQRETSSRRSPCPVDLSPSLRLLNQGRHGGEEVGGVRGAQMAPFVFAPYRFAGLYRVSQSGGRATAVTTIAPASGQRAHRWPQFLPDGRAFSSR